MVTIQEAQQQVAQQQQQLEAERKRIAETRLPTLTKQELLARTIQQRALRKGRVAALEVAKQKSLAELRRYETGVLQPYETKVSAAEKAFAAGAVTRKAYEVIQRTARGRSVPAGTTPAVLREVERLEAQSSEIRKIMRGTQAALPVAPTMKTYYYKGKTYEIPEYPPSYFGLKTQAEIARITGIPISKLKPPEEIARILARPPTVGVSVPSFLAPTFVAPKVPKVPTFDIREPYGVFGVAREKVERGFEWAGERVSERMLKVAERGVGEEIRIARPRTQIMYTPEGEKVLVPEPKRKPITMFGEAVKVTGKIAAYPLLGAERVTQLIFKPEVRKEIFPSPIYKPKVKFKEKVTEEGIEYAEPIPPLTVKERITWLGEAALGVGIGVGAIKGVTRFIKEPVVTYKPPPEPISYFKEVKAKQPILVAGKEIGEIPLAEYRILTTRYAPEKIITTKAREFFGMKPKKVIPPKPKVYVTAPVGTIIGETPYAAVTARVTKAGKIGKFKLFEITGEQAPTTMAAFEKLPAYKQRMWQRTVEAKVGRPVSLENVPKMLKEDERLAMGYIEAYEYFGKPGKKITRAEVVSIVKPIKPPIEGIKVYKVDVGFKPIPKAFPRAVGEVPILPGKIIDVGRLKPIEIGKKIDLSKFGIEGLPEGFPRARITPTRIQIQKQILEPMPIPKIVPKFAKVKPVTKVKVTPEVPKPLMVGGVGLVTIPFAGKGIYERTIGGLVPSAKPVVISDVKLETLPRVKEEVKLVPKLKVEEAFKPIEAVKVKPALKAIPITKQVPKLKALQKLKLIQKLKLKPALKMKIRQVIRPTPKIITKIRVPPPIPIPKAVTVKVTKTYKITKTEVGYDYYIRRAGKWIKMGVADTLEEAVRRASAIVAVTLAAAFKIMRKKEVVKAPFGRMFRPAKREVGVIVQRRKYRLAARAEVKEIQFFKKKKAKKTKWL